MDKTPASPKKLPSARIPALAAAAVVFVTAGYFQNSRPGWNVNSQFALTCAIAEQGTLSIDSYHDSAEMETGDKAFFEGRFYCDKSPVTSFLGVPGFWIYRTLAGSQFTYARARYFTTWFSVGICAAALVAMLTVLLVRFGVPPRLAALAAALWFLATPLAGYSILFFNYLPACAFALGGFVLIQGGRSGGSDHAAMAEPDSADTSARPIPAHIPQPLAPARLLAAGFLLGLAAWTLPTFGLLAVILTLALIARDYRRIAGLWPWALGGVLGASGYAIYSITIFGEVTSPYRYEFDDHFRDAMDKGLMGAGWPDLRVLWLITFHPFRGLFTLFPAALVAVVGCIGLVVSGKLREQACAESTELGMAGSSENDLHAESFFGAASTLAFFIGLLVYNSGYFMWWGGWAYAPRHLIPALPFIAVGLTPFLAGRSPWPVALVLLVLAAGAVFNVGAFALDPQIPPGLTEAQLMAPASVAAWSTPTLDLWRYLLEGNVDANWGTALGLRGTVSLAPLAVLWIIWSGTMLGLEARKQREQGAESSKSI